MLSSTVLLCLRFHTPIGIKWNVMGTTGTTLSSSAITTWNKIRSYVLESLSYNRDRGKSSVMRHERHDNSYKRFHISCLSKSDLFETDVTRVSSSAISADSISAHANINCGWNSETEWAFGPFRTEGRNRPEWSYAMLALGRYHQLEPVRSVYYSHQPARRLCRISYI